MKIMQRLDKLDDTDEPYEPNDVTHGTTKKSGIDHIYLRFTESGKIREKTRRSYAVFSVLVPKL